MKFDTDTHLLKISNLEVQDINTENGLSVRCRKYKNRNWSKKPKEQVR